MEFNKDGEAIAKSDVSTRTRDEALAAFAVLAFFEFGHLPPALALISAPIADLAWNMGMTLPICAETSVGLRKLLEAKDAFVRSAIPRTK
jgi:hypothetical protein